MSTDVRLRRLVQDGRAMQELAQRTEKIQFVPHGDPPDRYDLTYLCKGLIDQGGSPVEAREFRFTVALGPNYPTEPPSITAYTHVFHPNFSGSTVCHGPRNWRPAEGLVGFVLRIGRMIQYQNYNLDDPLNRTYTDWARRNASRFPIDPEPLLMDIPVVTEIRAPAVDIVLLSEEPTEIVILAEPGSEDLHIRFLDG